MQEENHLCKKKTPQVCLNQIDSGQIYDTYNLASVDCIKLDTLSVQISIRLPSPSISCFSTQITALKHLSLRGKLQWTG